MTERHEMEGTKEPPMATAVETMKAAIQTGYGSNAHDVLKLSQIAVPDINADQVLIKVAASSTNALDWHFMTGLPYFLRLQAGLRTPRRRIPGADVAGTVVAVGDDVTDFVVGDEVFGDIGGGAFAEYASARSRLLAHAPQNIPLEESATLGVAALTALQGLRDWADIKEGDRVLINGASGGVGTFAVQVARALGAAHITAVCSTHNVETALMLGADRVVDYTKNDFTDIPEKFDVFFDNAGSKSLADSRRMLAEDGVFVMITGRKGRWIRPADRMIGGVIGSKFWSQRFAGGTAAAGGEDCATLARMVEQGHVKPVIDRRFSLDEAVDAMAYQAAGHARGKSIVVVR